MDKPSKKKIIKMFKGVKEIKCPFDKEIIKLDLKTLHFSKFGNWCVLNDNKLTNYLWYSDKGQYAEIISYKEPLYQLTAKEVVHAYENPEYLKDTFKECFVQEYTIQEAESKFNIKIKAV